MSKIYGIGDEEELAEDLQKELFELKRNPNIIEIPDNATNGEVIKALFDIKEIEEMKHCVFVTIYPDYDTRFIKDWWNAPYKLSELKGENK